MLWSLLLFRENIVVSVPLHKENFQQLPMNLQKGGNIPIHSVLFNVGINEHATIAERYGHKQSFVDIPSSLSTVKFMYS